MQQCHHRRPLPLSKGRAPSHQRGEEEWAGDWEVVKEPTEEDMAWLADTLTMNDLAALEAAEYADNFKKHRERSPKPCARSPKAPSGHRRW